MPVPRTRHLVNDTIRSSDSDTYSLPLPENGQLHELLVRCAMTNGATSGHNVSILDVVDEIRVVGNGDNKYFQHHPREIEKWAEVLGGHGLDMLQIEQASAVQHGVFPIRFGRAAYDPTYFLPLDKVKAPRLEIVYSPTIAADAGFATGTFTVNVLAKWSPPSARLGYGGTLVSRAIKNFTTVASGDEETDIDINDPIRAIGVYCYENQVEDGVDISRVRLVANSGEFDVVQGDWLDLQQDNHNKWWTNVTHYFRLFAQDDDVIDTRLSNIRSAQIARTEVDSVANDEFGIISIDGRTGDRLTLNASHADITAGAETHVTDATDRTYYLSVVGDNPSYFVLLDWMDMDERSGYLNPEDFDKLQLLLSQGGAGGDCRIGVQYLRDVVKDFSS